MHKGCGMNGGRRMKAVVSPIFYISHSVLTTSQVSFFIIVHYGDRNDRSLSNPKTPNTSHLIECFMKLSVCSLLIISSEPSIIILPLMYLDLFFNILPVVSILLLLFLLMYYCWFYKFLYYLSFAFFSPFVHVYCKFPYSNLTSPFCANYFQMLISEHDFW